MITAKPLRVKHLGRQVRLETGIKSEPLPARIRLSSRPQQSLIEPTENYVENSKPLNIRGKVAKLLKTIVESGHGMDTYEVTNIMTAFCKAKNCFPIPEYNSVSSILKILCDKGEITRVKVNDKPYLYYKRY